MPESVLNKTFKLQTSYVGRNIANELCKHKYRW
jgi:hypothetical protein